MNVRRVGVLSFVLVVLSFGAISRAAREDAAAGRTITYTGYLEQSGSPVSGARELSFRLFESRTGGTPIWNGSLMVPVSAGRFVVELGGDDMTSLPSSAFSIPELWLQVSVGGVALGDRQRVGTSRHASNGVPAGTVIAFAAEDLPEGWLPCDGRALDGRRPEYGVLFGAIGTTWGNGTNDSDATTNFNLPDLRGRFIRGLDTTQGPEVIRGETIRDEDRSRRTPAAPGAPTGARVGTLQPDELRNHGHGWSHYRTGPGRNLEFDITYIMGGGTYEVGDTSFGGLETRPENAALVFAIKY